MDAHTDKTVMSKQVLQQFLQTSALMNTNRINFFQNTNTQAFKFTYPFFFQIYCSKLYTTTIKNIKNIKKHTQVLKRFNKQFTNRWQKCIQRRHHCWYYTFGICGRRCSVNFKMRWARYHSYYSGTVRTDKTDAACLLALTLDPFTTMTSGESTRTPRKSNACNEESIFSLSALA